MNDTLQTLIRSVLKIGAGYLIAKGHASAEQAQELSGGILAAVAVVWGVLHRTPSKPNPGVVGMLLVIGICAGSIGCAAFQKSVVTTNSAGITSTNMVFDVSAVLPEIKLAAKEGTRSPLQVHPEWRKEYLKAVDDLKALEALPTIDFSLVTEIVARVPAKELKSDTARIAIEGGTVLLNLADAYLAGHGKTVPLETVAEGHAIVTALREGVEQGLAGN